MTAPSATIKPARAPTCPPPMFPTSRAGVAAALAALGGTADRVADTLATCGRLGEPGESRVCPVAVYLHNVLHPAWPVSIAEATATVYRRPGSRIDVPLPDPVRVFVAAFDLGGYRFLYPAGYTDPDTAGRPVDPMARATAPVRPGMDTGPDIGPDGPGHITADTAVDTDSDMFADTYPDGSVSRLEGLTL
jgi:hypothetical protein